MRCLNTQQTFGVLHQAKLVEIQQGRLLEQRVSEVQSCPLAMYRVSHPVAAGGMLCEHPQHKTGLLVGFEGGWYNHVSAYRICELVQQQ